MEEVDDVDLYGRKAGPPGRPVVSDLEPASCLLRWEPPRHTGGRDVPIIGHYITVQFAGDGGFLVHTPDTGSGLPHAMLDGLRPDTWHEFQVSAITAEGRGAPSQASRPALTPRAAALHRNLARAKLQLTQTRAKLAERREALLRIGLADGAVPDPAQGLGRYGASSSAEASRMALREAKGGRRRRAALEAEIAELKVRAAEQLRALDELQTDYNGELRAQTNPSPSPSPNPNPNPNQASSARRPPS